MEATHKIENQVSLHAEEIKELVSSGALKQAMRRTQDLAKEVADREFRNQTVALFSRLNKLNTEARSQTLSIEDANRGTAVIVRDLLALIDEIQDFCEPQAPTLPRIPALRVVSVDEHGSDGDESAPQREHNAIRRSDELPEKTRFENAREEFRRRNNQPPETLIRPEIFSCRGLRKTYRSFSLEGVNLDLYPGEITSVVGINGSGKSTLMRMVAGELAATEGEICYPLLCPGRHDWATIRNQIAYVPQELPKWHGRLRQSLHLVAAENGILGQENRDEVEFILYRLGLDAYPDHRWGQISGGYKLRFELARALLSRPKLLILDEPLASLDVVSQQIFLQDLRDLANSAIQPLSVLLSSHRLHEIESIADRMVVLDEGRPIFCDSADKIGQDERENIFEVSSPTATYHDIRTAMDSISGAEVEVFGTIYHLRVSDSVGGSEVVNSLLGGGIEILHFRDISRSARRLFETKGSEL